MVVALGGAMSDAWPMIYRSAIHQRAYPLRGPACERCGCAATESNAKGHPRCYQCAAEELVDELRRRGAA